MELWFPLILVAASFQGAPLPRAPEPPDQSHLQGTWVVLPDRVDSVKFSNDILEMRQRNQSVSCRITVDERRTPHAIDLNCAGRTIYGIYRIEGKTLTVVLGDDKTRPADFNVRIGEMFRSITAVKE